jgi:hypothetical protein
MITARYRGARFGDAKGWRCDYCGEIGSFEELRKGECSHVHEPCSVCGGNPECEPTCTAMLEALSDAVENGAYVVDPETER